MRTRTPRSHRLAVGATAALLAMTASAAHADHGQRIRGETRIETAVAISDATFEGATTVIVTRSDLFADALSASYLASVNQAPILLTPPGSLAEATAAEIERQFAQADANVGGDAGRKKIYVLGGESAVSGATFAAISARFTNADVERVSGPDRYATNRAVLSEVGTDDIGTLGTSGRTALITRGDTFPDALSVGPISFEASFPVVLTRPGSLSDATLQVLSDDAYEYAIVVGGTAAVSNDVRDQLDDIGMGMQRVSGPNREATSVAVADFARTQLGFEQTTVGIANSRNFPDALAGGPYGGNREVPLLMIASPGSLGPEVTAFLQEQAGRIQVVAAIGGTAAVSDDVLQQANMLVGNSG